MSYQKSTTNRNHLKRVALYLRVSTGEQTTANQRRELEQVAKRSGWQVVEVYEDKGISGAKGRDGRPALDQMLRAAARREFDIVAAWSVDRLGRSLQDLVALLRELHAVRVDLYLHQQGIDTTTPSGKAMFQMMGVFAEFERAMIRERIMAGLERARAEGKKSGRKPLDYRKRKQVAKLRGQGMGTRAIARKLGISPASVLKYGPEVQQVAAVGASS